MTSWIAPTAVPVGDIMAASEDALRVDDFQYLYDHRHDVLYIDRTQTTLANSTTETTVATYTVPAGMLSSNGILTFRALIRGKCTSANNNQITMKIKYGGTSFGSLLSEPAGATPNLQEIWGTLVANGATNAQVGIVQTIPAMLATENTRNPRSVYADLAIDSTVAQDLILTLANGRLNADASWTYFYFVVFGLP